ncbi:MAG TPA: hypothetical protein IAA08_01475 [Candidatus Eubacterium avistercoris]|uniref:Uncharacterized protein n=1 Tax=Candidatus Eubacterium avistercoris TaxID=2838567 RepID=A0A9D2D119_9FIRM|nr:hypothetical protein [Candidatus Eubacterium avistercoris]
MTKRSTQGAHPQRGLPQAERRTGERTVEGSFGAGELNPESCRDCGG